ncbi:MAG: hypothetical protein P4M14_01460 [Gammaproteobacteria bacterium]|nr:hypothetical protein [Gammaproteobacteria bacterium]
MAESKQLLGKLLAQQVKQMPANTPLHEVEFSVYSQFGEDGIIQFITHHLQDKIKNKIFVEIGVQNYSEANTRFLLENDAWQGVILDACLPDVKQIHASDFYWRNNLFAKHAFVTRDNVNSLLTDLQLPSEIGLLSVDIDGNDYWVLEKIEAVKPAIIIVEYNSFFGAEAAISLPYRENFVWQQHHPATYFGASLAAFCFHLEQRGYELLGSTLAGNNAFFVNKAINQGKLRAVTCADGYRKALFNSIPSPDVDKFSHQLKCLQYQQVVDVTDLSYKRLSGSHVTNATLSNDFNHKNDFLHLENEVFLHHAYRYLLCRERDVCGFLNHLAELKRGVPKEEMLERIRFSEEGREVAVHIAGLQQKAQLAIAIS